ncbi:hypothetical protein V493_05536, partial [Pseudogymnoascus sp. VKM F-4281 (FW-2241)]
MDAASSTAALRASANHLDAIETLTPLTDAVAGVVGAETEGVVQAAVVANEAGLLLVAGECRGQVSAGEQGEVSAGDQGGISAGVHDQLSAGVQDQLSAEDQGQVAVGEQVQATIPTNNAVEEQITAAANITAGATIHSEFTLGLVLDLTPDTTTAAAATD